MKEMTYRTKVTRRRGKWRVSVPALPRDAPVLEVAKLDNAAILMIEEIAGYLGASMQSISVIVDPPTRPVRRGLRRRITVNAIQLYGAAAALTGVYLLAGFAYTLLAAGIATGALGVLREAGKI